MNYATGLVCLREGWEYCQVSVWTAESSAQSVREARSGVLFARSPTSALKARYQGKTTPANGVKGFTVTRTLQK
ncbi:unnamed protein product [Lepidochelys olivacea]